MSDFHEADRLIAGIAARRHGVFTRSAARACGLPAGTIDWRARNGKYRSMWPTVYSLPGVPDTWEKHAMAGVLHAGPGAALSGWAAARKLVLPGFEKKDIEITTPKRVGSRA
jgi:hypothetical protein